MIFYFTGTGNSLYAAKTIAEVQGEQLVSIAMEMDGRHKEFVCELKENEVLGFVFPVYAWGPPRIVLDFIGKLKISSGNKPYAFSLCTCGDEEGCTTKIFKKALERKGIALDSSFTLRMPNNYILGFDVDPKKVEKEKLDNAALKLQKFNKVISDRKTGYFDLVSGKHPGLKTAIVNPLFNHFALNAKKFSVDDTCTGCGLCEKVCPIHTISVDKRPVWSKACTQCLACINRCPVHAIQYGNGTKKKGRYYHQILAHPICETN